MCVCFFFFGGGGYSLEFLVGVCSTILQTLTLFQAKICNFLGTLFQTWCLKFIPIFRPSLLNPYPFSVFQTKMVEIYTLFQTKIGSKTCGAAHTYMFNIVCIGEYRSCANWKLSYYCPNQFLTCKRLAWWLTFAIS